MIVVETKPWQAMVIHAERAYPNECCGGMLGHLQGDRKIVSETVPFENAFDGQKTDRYEIRPEDLLAADRAARERGLDLIGIYHSHPDCDAYFSATDLKNSCPWYSFVVLSVKNGKFDHGNSFVPDVDQTRAEREDLSWQKS